MPPLPLTNALQTALPPLSATSRAVVSALACCNAHAASANEIAAWVGLRDRHQLARGLRRDGLPPLEQLAGWARVLYWVLEAESGDRSLLELARREQLDPAVAYRLVHRVTGLRWSQVRRAGLAAMLARFRGGCPDRATTRTPVAAAAPRDRPSWARCEPGWAQPRRASLGHPAAVLSERLLVAGNPFDVAIAADGTAYLTRVHAAAVECLELAPFRLTGSIATGSAPTAVVLSSSSRVAYVTNQLTEEVAVIDLSRLRQRGTIPVRGHPLGAALSPDGRKWYVVQLDRPTLRVLGSLGTGGKPRRIAFDAAGRTALIANEAGWVDLVR